MNGMTNIGSLIMDCLEDKIIYQGTKPTTIQLSEKAYNLLLEELEEMTNFKFNRGEKGLTSFSGYPIKVDSHEEGIKIVVY